MNLVEGVIAELNRNRELLQVYKEIPAGAFAAINLANDIQRAEAALVSGDAIEMLRVYKLLKENKE